MAAESVLYALTVGVVASTRTLLLLPGLSILGNSAALGVGLLTEWSLPTQLMISLGAGIYEELLFRVILVSGLVWLVTVGFGWGATRAKAFAVCLGALIF